MRGRGAVRSRWLSVACGLLHCACGGAPEPRPARPPLVTEQEPAPTAPALTDAHWVFHPSSGAIERASLRIDAGRLAVGDGGERWLSREGEPPLGSPFAAPESLIGVGRSGARFAFVGASGTVYLADDPLGAFVAVRSPPQPFVDVAAHGDRLAAVQSDGTLWAGSELGARWAPAKAPNVQVVDVALAADGRGLALAVPESWLATNDGGQSWQAVTLPPLGAQNVTTDSAGRLVVDGLFRRARYEAGHWVSEPVGAREERRLAADLGPAPDARAIDERRAVLDGKIYVAFERRGPAGARKWALLRGELGGRLTANDVKALNACRELVVAAHGQRLAVLCAESSAANSSGPLRLFTSDDGGVTFRPREIVLRGIFNDVRLAVDASGVVLASGLCAPHLTAAGCAPRGAYRFEPSTDRQLAVALSGLAHPEALAWGAGGRAYAAGPRDKDGRIALYVSHDGGKSFRPSPSEAFPAVAPDVSRGEGAAQLVVDDEGVLSLVTRTGTSLVLVTTDAEGRVLSAGEGPGGARVLAGAGMHALAVSPETRSVWQSSDGGASWELVSLPRGLCAPRTAGERECEAALACSTAGCVIGDSLSRLGWGASEGGAASALPAIATETGPERQYKTPLSCVLGREPWQLVPGLTETPRANDAAIGRVVWMGVGADLETGAVWALHAPYGKSTLTRQTLLGPVAEPTRYALAVSPQIEGSVALRYMVPQSSRHTTEISDVEVAWDNRIEDVIAHGRLAGSVSPLPGDYESRAPRTLSAVPALLSIASGGVYLRLHNTLGDRQPTYYFDGRTVREVPRVPWPEALLRESRTEMMRLGTSDVPVAFIDDGSLLAWAHETKTGFGLDALTIGHPNAMAAGLVQAVSIGYTGKAPGFVVVQTKPLATWWKAYAVTPTAPSEVAAPGLSAPHPVALQADLPDPPAPCTDEVRSREPRVVAPAFPGGPHPILITDASEPPRVLVTERAVLHGSPQEPCVAAFEASTPRGAVRPSLLPGSSGGVVREPRITAIVPMSDLAHAWAFQEIRQSEWQVTVQARPMSCRFDATLTIPRELVPRLGSPRANDDARSTNVGR